MANDFSSDTDCMALWKLDDGTLMLDSKGGNTLTNNGLVTNNTSDKKEGDASGSFSVAGVDYLHIDDAALDTDFPFKLNDTHQKISVACWCKFSALDTNPVMASKWGGSGTWNWQFYGKVQGATRRFTLAIGYSNGSLIDETQFESSIEVVTGRWYHVAFTFQNSDRVWKIRVYDATADTVAESGATFGFDMSVDPATFMIGGNNASNPKVDGLIDEVVVFKDILTSDEIDEIRSGTYGSTGTVILRRRMEN